jgi:asparagine synthase (glutamine-hydrolysing)
MCGIWTYISKNKLIKESKLTILKEKFLNIKGRGPETENYLEINDNVIFGFHRLCIVDVSEAGNQPFVIKDDNRELYLMCNGEIYNKTSLIDDNNLKCVSNSDCEPILHLYKKYGIEKTVDMLDGVFAFSIMDIDLVKKTGKLIVGRDRIGVRPMFMGHNENKEYGFSSEIKGLTDIFNSIEVFTPGTIVTLSYNLDNVDFKFMKQVYYPYDYETKLTNLETVCSLIKYQFTEAVKKRLMSDRPICCLLSGGLDSSLVTSIVASLSNNPIHTFSIGMKGGTDFKYAKMVADKIGSIHTEILFSKEEGINSIRDVIWAIESYDITTVRASVGQYLISKYIKDNTDNIVVYIGDGSDELTGGYKYFCNAPDSESLHKECVKLIKEIHLYDCLRADRAVSIHGLETRVPFLDSSFVDLYLSIDPKLRMPVNGIEKYLLRKAFDDTDLLPKEVLWREKEAFSDGISSQKDSWFTILQNHIDTEISDAEFNLESKKYTHNTPLSKEAYYYRKIFGELFGEKHNDVIPHFWLPNWSGDITEPSARVLDVYKSNNTKEKQNSVN